MGAAMNPRRIKYDREAAALATLMRVDAMSVEGLCAALQCDLRKTREALRRQVVAGFVQRVAVGVYALTEHGRRTLEARRRSHESRRLIEARRRMLEARRRSLAARAAMRGAR